MYVLICILPPFFSRAFLRDDDDYGNDDDD